MNETSTPRSIKDGPFCWASKEALRRIGEHFGESNRVPAARTVYLALCELASNEQAECFQAKVATIAKFAGVSYRTVSDVLPELEFIKALYIEQQTIEGSKLKAPSFYTVLPIGNGFPSIGDNCLTIGNGPEQTSVAENLKNLEKNLSEESVQETLSPLPASRSAAGKVQKAKQPKATKPESPADPRFAPVTNGYCTAYLETFGQPYVHNGGRDGKRLKQFLATANPQEFTAERIVKTARAAMQRSTEPFAKATKFSSSLHGFCDQFNPIRAELNELRANGQGPHAAKPKRCL